MTKIDSVITLESMTRSEELAELIARQEHEINRNLLTLRYATTQDTVNDCVEKHDAAVARLCELKVEQDRLERSK